MTVVGFNFNKIVVEKKTELKGEVSIKNNIAVTDVQDAEVPFDKSQKGLKFTFDFNSTYEPKIGNIRLTGDVLFIGDVKKVKEISDSWKKAKSVPKDVLANIMNVALTKCNIQALILSQVINLPAPIPLPKVQAQVAKK
jgi:hypothetical protein